MTFTIKPVGYHIKNNPIKALYYANFYKPKNENLSRYIQISEMKGTEFNEELANKIKPYESVIGRYLKSINKKLKLQPVKSESGKDSLLYTYGTLTKNCKENQFTTPVGFGSLPLKGDDPKRNAIGSVMRFLESLAKE